MADTQPRPPLLEARALSKRFLAPVCKQVLNGIDLTLNYGEKIAITGASGSGKSTLLHLLGTLEQPSSGTLYLQGEEVDPRCAPRIRSCQVGLVFQNFNLLEDYTVWDNLLMPRRIQGGRAMKGLRASLQSLLDEVQFPYRRVGERVRHLSGGEKQRIALVRALVNSPALILADEPSGNLDQASAHLVEELLFGTLARRQAGLILVTHDLDLARRCDRLYRLSGGLLHSL